MDPNDILALIAGGGGSVLVIGAGAWAYVRSRGKKKSSDDRTSRDGTDPADRTAGSRSSTAVKDRPAAPTWADTLSAPATKPAEDPSGATAPETEEQPAEESAPTSTDGDPGTGSVAEAPQDAPAPGADTATTEEQAGTPEQTAAAEPGTAAPEPASDTTAPPAEPTTAAAESDTAAAEPTTAPAESDTAPAGADTGAPALETPEAPADRMVRLRERLSRSGALGRGILGLLTRGSIDEGTWDEIEETLLLADLGPDATDEMLENLRRRIQVLGTDDTAAVHDALREELLTLVDPSLDRRLAATRRDAPDGTVLPSVMLMVGVNGTGKTTTVGKLARVLVAAERSVVLGAADTFRAAAAEQLTTWGSRVGVDTVRSDREGADPAAVAFDAVKTGIDQEVDVVIIDTAGRLQNKKGLMDELGKVRRVAEKGLHGDEVAEVLLVIDATTGQNGMQQARVFSEAVNITGIVLTKLDGTAKGGIVVNVQRELGVPVKMVGLGEGMDDLTPFDPHGFVDALLGD
ncbi:signal recognition particle-docking protein FtsY [Brachybacterium fresconis]|uniref:Signal recognition particle receptor FtsY n=1 Tax=Brachybacterium fresconis TaxID=173363 RepID=A0ABS4YPM0_9MICO|nr:fused signal recognition particle receptor [Brachybacterium fresconis]